MRKFILLFSMLGCGYTYASTIIDLSKSTYTCNGKLINKQITESSIMLNCKNTKIKSDNDVVAERQDHVSGKGADQIQFDDNPDTVARFDTISFVTDKSEMLSCHFKNKSLTKCAFVGQATK